MTKKIILGITTLSILLYLYPTALIITSKNNDDIEILLAKSLSSKKMSLLTLSLHRKVLNEINGKKVDYNLLGITFLSAKELIKNKEKTFVSASIDIKQKKALVTINCYKAGMAFYFKYEKIDGIWIIKENTWGLVKFAESRPYYIYWSIIKRIDPNYMNFDLFPIPKDSIQ